jgi:cyclophilin family peptidyl-prolyl cis-trans isomerase
VIGIFVKVTVAMRRINARLLKPTWRWQSSTGVPASLSPIPPVGQKSGGIQVYGPNLPPVERVKTLPLSLVEEVPLAPMVLTEVELLMRAWSEDHARHWFRMTLLIRIAVGTMLAGMLYLLWKTYDAYDRRIRGADFMPSGLRIGSVVYFDISTNGREVGRIVIGLLNENCPLYCEYFHRRCTGSGGNSESFRGMKVQALIVRNAAIFGDGPFMQHGIPGYNQEFLPTEYKVDKPWRGALSSIAYGPNRESPNFAIHLCSGDFSPQVFGMVIGGYEVLERISFGGTTHGCDPKQEWVIEGCGELCTLDKTKVVPMPWQLFESVSNGFDQDKFGKLADKEKIWAADTTSPAVAPKRKLWIL